MRTIWKFPLKLTGERQVLTLPASHQFNFVAVQDGILTLWYEVNPEADPRRVSLGVYICGTGHPIPDLAVVYLGSVLMGPFVWHIYSEAER